MNQSSENRPSVTSLLAFLWLFLIVLAYYIYHKPITSPQVLSLSKLSWEFLAPSLITCAAAGLGRRILPLNAHQPLVRIAIQAGLGFGLMSIGLLVIGALGGYLPILCWILLIAMLIYLKREIIAWWRDWSFLRELLGKGGGLGRCIAVFISLILFFTLTIALSPPLKFDTLVYHLPLPKTYLEAGRFLYVPENMFWGMPQTGEMLFTWVISLAGNSSAIVLGWLWGILALVGLAGYIFSNFGGRSAWVSLAALLAGFSLSASLSWGYIDWLVILFGFGFFVFLESWRRENNQTDFVLASIFAGLALSVKYTAGILLISGVLSIITVRGNHSNIIKKLGSVGLWVMLAILVASPWLVKNFVATGNPIYPFLFPSGAMDHFRIEHYRGTAVENPWLMLFFLPIRATVLGIEAGPGYSAAIGPLLLGFSTFTLLGWRRSEPDYRNKISSAICIVLPALITWVIVSRFSDYLLQTRLYFAILPAVVFLAGAGFYNLERLSSVGIRYGWLSGAVVIIVLGFTVFEVGASSIQMGSNQSVFGIRSDDDYLTDNLGWYYPAMREIKSLPVISKVLMLWEPRSLYCLPQCVPDEILDRWLHERKSSTDAGSIDPENILIKWRQTGYSYLLINQVGADYIKKKFDPAYQVDDWIALEGLLSKITKIKDFGGAYSLYSLNP